MCVERTTDVVRKILKSGKAVVDCHAETFVSVKRWVALSKYCCSIRCEIYSKCFLGSRVLVFRMFVRKVLIEKYVISASEEPRSAVTTFTKAMDCIVSRTRKML